MSDTVVEHAQLKRCDLLTLHGRIDGSKAPAVEAELKEITDAGRYRFVIDLTDVAYISSGFLRVLISTLKSVKRWNRGNIHLAGMSPRIRDVFDLAGLLPLFQVYDTVPEAVGDW
ncbi:MAG: STAS domain-containing protein [Chloroflexota bacterium]|nr:STAS domain-containing protein [Chloroflexota bacterium]